ncbi:MAG: TIGR03792 family protein [Cyanobacteria bacterium CRU_2_1]|nr:TIGR03792 family protein [Cyanobacteria bacterium RU_5_0]NJR60219.1 TIGR03792 family protein [Cyanobacteria bacterium CRU_2_1]
MEIEWLKFRVDPELREQFVQRDADIWTPVLAQYPGFIRKEVWISPDDLSEVVEVIHWETFEQWQAIPSDVLEQTEAEFAAAMGNTYELISGVRYQVRKFYAPGQG